MDDELRETALGVRVPVGVAPETLYAVLLAVLEQRGVDGLGVLQLAVHFVGQRPRHADADDAHVHAVDAGGAMAQERKVVEVLLGGRLDDLERARAAELEHEDLAGLVEALAVVVAGLQLVLQVRSQPVGGELVLADSQQHAVGHEQAVLIDHDAVAGLADLEGLEAVDEVLLQEAHGVCALEAVRERGVEAGVNVARLVGGQHLVAPSGVLERLHAAQRGVRGVAGVERVDARVVGDVLGVLELPVEHLVVHGGSLRVACRFPDGKHCAA